MYSAQDLAKMERLYARVKRQRGSTIVSLRILIRPYLNAWVCAPVYALSFLNTCTTYTFPYLEREPITHLYLAIGAYEEEADLINYFMCRTRFTKINETHTVSSTVIVRLPPNIQQLLLDHYTPFTVYRPTSV